MPRTDGTCLAVGAKSALSAPSCPSGTMAIPGEVACREVSVCKPQRWPDGLPATGVTYVDAAYSGVEDGTDARPFRTIGQALEVGRFIAVAEGRYPENLKITKPTKIVALCARAVEIVGNSTYTVDATSDLELHDVTIRGTGVGVGIIRGKVILDHVWIREPGDRAIDIEDFDGPAELILRDSLLERPRDIALFASGVTVTVERSVLRGTRVAPGEKWAQGIQARGGITSKLPSSLTMRRSLVEDMTVFGVAVNDSNATIEDSILRKTHATSESPAAGLTTQKVEGRARVQLTLLRTLFSDNEGVGADCADAVATLDEITIHGVGPKKGAGLLLDRSDANVAHLTVYDVAGIGASARGSKVSFASTWIHDIRAGTDGRNGAGMVIESRTGVRSAGTVSDLFIERATAGGLLVFGSTVDAEDVTVLATAPFATGSHGDGASVLSVFYDDGAVDVGKLSLTRAILANNARAGIAAFAATARVEGSILCNPINIDVERTMTFADGSSADHPVVLEDGGNNTCGCAIATPCAAQSTGLAPAPN